MNNCFVGGNFVLEFAKREQVHDKFWTGDDLKIYMMQEENENYF